MQKKRQEQIPHEPPSSNVGLPGDKELLPMSNIGHDVLTPKESVTSTVTTEPMHSRQSPFNMNSTTTTTPRASVGPVFVPKQSSLLAQSPNVPASELSASISPGSPEIYPEYKTFGPYG